MKTLDIALPGDIKDGAVIAAIESACAEKGLTIALKTGLASYPGSTHWHYKRGCAHGTLEITYWPHEQRAWFSIHANRQAHWIDEMLPALSSAIQTHLEEPPSLPLERGRVPAQQAGRG